MLPIEFRSKFNARNISLLLISLFLLIKAYLILQSVYPFMGTADGWHRLYMAQGDDRFSVLPPALQYIYWLFLSLTGGIAAFTFTQIIIFYVAILALCLELLPNNKISALIAAFLLLQVGVFEIFPSIMTDSSLVFSSMAFVAILINKHFADEKPSHMFFLFFVTAALFSLRFNSITTLPVLILALALSKKNHNKRYIFVVILAFVSALAINYKSRENSRPEALGMAWEITGVVKNSNDPDIMSSLDFCGNTAGASSAFNVRALNNIMWSPGSPLSAKCLASPGGSDQVKRVYLSTVKDHFGDWLKLKMMFMSESLGINRPLEVITYGVNDFDERTIKWGGVGGDKYRETKGRYESSASLFSGIVYRPYISFLIVIALMLLSTFIHIKGLRVYVIASLLSASYYGAFLISAQSMEFRYFAPSFFINSTLTLCLAFKIYHQFRTSLINKR